MNDDHEMKLDRKVYQWSLENNVVSWVEPRTNMVPSATITHRLNRLFLNKYVESIFEAWGQENLPEFHAFLKEHGASREDYESFGMGFLLKEADRADWQFRSPLHVLGYRVGINGVEQQARREILRKALLGELPIVGSSEYMATWGLPGTESRLYAICGHIRRSLATLGRVGADYSKAFAEWKADREWLYELFEDENGMPETEEEHT